MVILALMALSSCGKKGVNLFVGDYSFKTSGELAFTMSSGYGGIDLPASLNVSMSTDIGQLNISASDKKNDEVVVVINYFNGDVVVTTGTCNGNTIVLDAYQRSALPVTVTTLMNTTPSITVSGTGQMFDDDMIVFDMTYNGSVTLGETTYRVKDKDIKMVAYRN